MARFVDLNADMGESFGDWKMGNDAAVLGIVSSANIACGFHAGDPDVMAATMRLAIENGVGIGAHPGFADLQGFGRRPIKLAPQTLQNSIRYQLGASLAMARSVGGTVRHFKLHGAMSNMSAKDADMARLCYTAALDIAPEIVIMVQAATVQQDVVEELGCAWAGEIFADRAYNDNATLVDRSLPGAVIHDAEFAARRISDMVAANAIIAISGKKIATRIDTICLHGDTPEAVDIARAVRAKLAADGVVIRKL